MTNHRSKITADPTDDDDAKKVNNSGVFRSKVIDGGLKKVQRRRNRIFKEIRDQQKSTVNLLNRAPFGRCVREVSEDMKTGMRWKNTALEAVREAAQDYLVGLFSDAVLIQCNEGKRQTLAPRDIQVALRIRGERA